MNDYNPRPLADLIDPGWARALAPVEERVHELGAMLAQDVEEGLGYLPAGTDVLRAFTYPFDEVKVLIVGQDPYPTPGHAMGLSFSVRPGVALPKSLINIFRELGDDIGCPAPTSGDLTAWRRRYHRRPLLLPRLSRGTCGRAGCVSAQSSADGPSGCTRLASGTRLGGGHAVCD